MARKGRRKYSLRRCGKPADVNCNDHTGNPVCINCDWPKIKASSLVMSMMAKDLGNKVSQAV